MAGEERPTAGRHRRRRSRAVRIVTWTLLTGVTALLLWGGLTLSSAYRRSDGEPAKVIVATWMRDNGMGPLVARLEDVYYRYVDPPQVGGTPTLSADLAAEDSAGADDSDVSHAAAPVAAALPGPLPLGPAPPGPPAAASVPTMRDHLDPPPAITSPVATPEPKEGQWQPVASRVNGIPAVYVTRVRADDVHTGYYASVMWIDTTLTKAVFVPGYEEPGGPNPYGGALPQDQWPDVLANFNGAFRLEDSMGGYYYDGVTVSPLLDGRASTVIYRDGSIEVGRWGRDLAMSDDVQMVRQNLNLIVDKGASKVQSQSDNVVWGATTDKESLAWRAAVGQRGDGSIVYVGSPYLSAQGLADVLVGAGVERAMVLDMNDWWTAGFYFRHKKDGTPLCRKLDPSISEGCDRFLRPYKRDSFHFVASAPQGIAASVPQSASSSVIP